MDISMSMNAYDETRLHSERVASISVIIGHAIGLGLSDIEKVYAAALYHDEGKKFIPDQVLNSPVRLSEKEYEEMKRHTEYGEQALRRKGYGQHFLDAALYHHERYDGNGYPRGLKGDDIPLIARIVAVADFYEAMTAKRVYKDEMSHSYVCSIIEADKGRHFDPEVVDVFLSAEKWIESDLAMLDMHHEHAYGQEAPENADAGLRELEKRFGPLSLENGCFLCNADHMPVAVVDSDGRISEIPENACLAAGMHYEQRSDYGIAV